MIYDPSIIYVRGIETVSLGDSDFVILRRLFRPDSTQTRGNLW